MNLTDKQKIEHVKNQGTLCPSCKSDQIVGDCIDHEHNHIRQEMFCNDCYLEWVNIYKLTLVLGAEE